MKKKKEQILLQNLTIDSMASEGKCVSRHEGLVVFSKNTAPGDIVDLVINKKKKSFWEGYPQTFHKYSERRATPPCPHFGICGGCKWQHINYETQLLYKQQHVEDALTRLVKLTLPPINTILAAPEIYHYRNKLEFTFSNKRWLSREEIASDMEIERNGLGFHIPGRFDKVLDITDCHLQGGLSNEIRNWIRQYAKTHHLTHYNLINHQGFLRTLMIRTSTLNETMVLLQVAEKRPEDLHALLEAMGKEFPQVTSLNYVLNTKKNDTLHELSVVNFAGKPFILEQMGDLQFIVGPKSFYQTNSAQAKNLYDVVLKMADLSGEEIVYDLYTGTGTIANYCAHEAKKVIGVEYVPEAIADAEKNADLNKIANTLFFAGDMKEILTAEFVSAQGTPQVIITDPPRAGMHEDVLQMILHIAPQKVVYVSCNPATQARDLQILHEKYDIVEVQPVDMFPHTHHIENVVLLNLRS